jgi:hypothetical protein
MRSQGDIKRPRSVKAEFDPEFAATPLGGGVLVEQMLRSLGLQRLIGEHLRERSGRAHYSTIDAVYALVAGLLVGGRGLEACEALREDALAEEIFGLEKGAPSSASIFRVLCHLSGLVERSASEWYEKSGPALEALDMWGRPRRLPATRRIVPETPEEASEEQLRDLAAFLGATARRCARALPKDIVRTQGWTVVFGDGTDLEVEGNCFDAARMGREGAKIVRWLTLMLGPVIVAQQLMAGNRDEGVSMPRLLEEARPVVRDIAGRLGQILALLDAAYFEKLVIEGIDVNGWDFIVCANQQRQILQRLVEEQQEWIWADTGADARRGWTESQVGCFVHMPESWSKPVTIVVRRWREEGDLPGSAWHYSFLATRIEPAQLPASLRKHGYAEAIWMLYGTKQARENHYKTALRDLGLHHPPSGRHGINQAFYAIASAASNIAMVLRYRVVAPQERGIELWRLRERYLRISGYLVRTGRTLWVRLSGVSVNALRQTLWEKAFAAAGRL